jgi:hypothetical protein
MGRGRTTRRLAKAIALGLASTLSSCVDTKPIAFDFDASSPVHDAGIDASLSPCVRCLQTADQPGPGCLDELKTCQRNPVCAAVITCTTAAGCFDLGSQNDVILCGLPCAVDAGATAQEDIEALAYDVFTCMFSHCDAVCGRK